MTKSFARGIAAQCWCDPRVSDREMDSELAEVFAEKLEEYIYALAWCECAPCFDQGGTHREGFLRTCRHLMREP
jgi:hypothetical protein